MRITEELKIFASELSLWQQVKIVGVVLIVLVLGISGWWSSCSQTREIRKQERAAAHAKADADKLLEKAAAVAEEIRRKEGELRQLEEKVDEKYQELERAGRNSDDARREYDRVRNEPRKTVPTGDELCRELAELGYPCR